MQQLPLKDRARTLATSWRARMDPASSDPPRVSLQPHSEELVLGALAEFVAATIHSGQTMLLVVPDDQWLPELSNALDLAVRPLCLVLPGQGFAAATALRATLALLKSRLARGGEAAWTVAWDAQRIRLEQHTALWQLTLNWSTSGHGFSAWPSRIHELFPVCILPSVHAEAMAGAPRDLLLLFQPERFAAKLPKLLPLGNHSLLLEATVAADPGGLAPGDEQTRLNIEYAMLAQELGDMELEFATVQAELAEFTRVYHAQIGARMAELDALQARIASCYADRIATDETLIIQAEQAQAQAERSRREHRRFAELDREEDKSFRPTVDLKRLFRQLAQRIHPDRAEDENDRSWRTELMSEANRAYRAGDEMVLHEILSQWQAGRQDRPSGKSRNATTAGLARQVSLMQRRLAEIEAELGLLLASRLYELFVAAGVARQRGRDLLQEMAGQLDAQIDLARTRLEHLETV